MKDVLLKVIPWALAAAFLMAGVTKLIGHEMQVDTFNRLGLESWMLYVVGGIETAGALMLASKNTRMFGAGLLALEMVGAACLHMYTGVDLGMIGANVMMGGAAGWLALETYKR